MTLCDTAQLSLEAFRTAMSNLRMDQQSLMNAESPLALAVTSQLEVITVWFSMHARLLESLES